MSKPGTNEYHGTAFWNYNSDGLNANPNYFNPSQKANASDNHNFGGSIGGRLIRNKTFFFGTFERLDIKLFQSTAATVPQAAYRTGDFSSLSTPIIDPSTGQPFRGTSFRPRASTRWRGRCCRTTFRRRTKAPRRIAMPSMRPRRRTSSTSAWTRTSRPTHCSDV